MTGRYARFFRLLQEEFPLEERPFRAMAERLNAEAASEGGNAGPFSEEELFAKTEELRESGAIRRVGGVYDSARLGFVSRLCAGKVPSAATGAPDDSALERFAAAVLEIPAVTHNYVRDHAFNVWFTVVARSEEEIRAVVDGLRSATALRDAHLLPATRKFKIDTVMGGVAGGARGGRIPAGRAQDAAALGDSDRARIRVACGDLPRALEPFAAAGLDLDGLRADLASGRMRRFGAVLRHQKAGFAKNAMLCLDVPEAEIVRAGEALARDPRVSHCYARPPFEGFPYGLYAMVHARSDEELERALAEAVEAAGSPAHAALRSVRELKKTSFAFFA